MLIIIIIITIIISIVITVIFDQLNEITIDSFANPIKWFASALLYVGREWIYSSFPVCGHALLKIHFRTITNSKYSIGYIRSLSYIIVIYIISISCAKECLSVCLPLCLSFCLLATLRTNYTERIFVEILPQMPVAYLLTRKNWLNFDSYLPPNPWIFTKIPQLCVIGNFATITWLIFSGKMLVGSSQKNYHNVSLNKEIPVKLLEVIRMRS